MLLKNSLKDAYQNDMDSFLDEVSKYDYSLLDLLDIFSTLNLKLGNDVIREFMKMKYFNIYTEFINEELVIERSLDLSTNELLDAFKLKYKYLNHISNPLIILLSHFYGDTTLKYLIMEDYIKQVEESERCRF